MGQRVSLTNIGALQDAIRDGKCFSAFYTQTIGGAAQGFYSLGVFNPSTSHKNMFLFSAKSMVNFGSTTTTLVLPNANPGLDTSVIPLNMSTIPNAAPSAMVATADSTTTSFPGSGLFEQYSQMELIGNYGYVITPTNAVQIFVFCGNSQQYMLGMKWFEF